jgi:hypothetical protein
MLLNRISETIALDSAHVSHHNLKSTTVLLLQAVEGTKRVEGTLA